MAEQHGKALVPQIRFAGFTDPWEQRKVGDFLSESRVKGNTGLDSRKLTVKLWGKGVIEKNDFGGSEHTQYFIRHTGQFIYSKLDFLNSAFGVIPEKLDGYESTADLPAFDLVGMNPYFMFFTAIQEGFYLKHGSAADGSRKAKRIHVNTFLEMPVMVPTVAEQDLIVEYLQSLDCLITLHQRKYDKLCVLKKSMLDKMFPKGGSLYPEIRFAGFTDPWEQRKLGELSNEFKSGEFICADNVSVSGPYPVYGGNGLRGYTTTFNHEGLYTLIGRQGALCGNVNIADGKSYFTEHAVAVKANHLNDTTFLYYLFGTLDLGQYSGQSAQPGLAVSNLVEVEAMVPDKAEQKKISRVFKTVDSLITLHQRKLELLRNIKKSMLDKMFV